MDQYIKVIYSDLDFRSKRYLEGEKLSNHLSKQRDYIIEWEKRIKGEIE